MNIKNQTIPKIIAKLNDRAKIIPKKVAIPFPPLNFSQIEKICPKKHISPAI